MTRARQAGKHAGILAHCLLDAAGLEAPSVDAQAGAYVLAEAIINLRKLRL